MGNSQESREDAESAPFEPDVLLILRRIKRALADVFPASVWQWENLCRYQLNPKHEVLHWLRIAQLYQACRPAASRGQPQLTKLKRHAVFDAICWCYQEGPEHALNGKPIHPECVALAEAAVHAFRVGPSEKEIEEVQPCQCRPGRKSCGRGLTDVDIAPGLDFSFWRAVFWACVLWASGSNGLWALRNQFIDNLLAQFGDAEELSCHVLSKGILSVNLPKHLRLSPIG